MARAIFASGLLFVASSAIAAPGDNAIGINVHHAPSAIAAAAADLGVKWIRVDANWFQLEPSRDQYQWGPMDQSVANANMNNLKVYMTLAYTPSWEARHGDTDGASNNDVPNNSTEWTEFVRDAVTRYRAQGVTHFGIWNEPNLDHFWEGSLAEYASIILTPGAAAVRQACADCLVLGPDLANVGDADDYLTDLLNTVPVTTFDIIAHHSYQGFEETGVRIWDGDRYFNVLDQQRFSFTRRDLKSILDAAGYTGEVWMTETGYRATPGDASEEALQATYIRRVIEEQLSRAWYTNTFFYEVLDCRPYLPTCDIDGFGLMRSTGSTNLGAQTFPHDFRLKPAWTELKNIIANNPQLSGTTPALACGDGVDNDNDGRIDLADRGCADGMDNDESNDPPRVRLDALRTPGITLDGDFNDVGSMGWITVDAASWRGTEPLSGPNDLGVRVAARWTVSDLRLAIEVTDDTHQNDRPDAELWQGDSVQLAFDVRQTYGDAYDNTDDHEINFGLSNGQSRSFRYHGPAGASNDFATRIVRQGGTTRYEIRVGWNALGVVNASPGNTIGFSFVVNDADGSGRVGWSQWTRGIADGKAPYWFGEIQLANTIDPMPPPQMDAGVVLPDAVVNQPDAQPMADSGVTTPDAAAPDARVSVDAGVASMDAGTHAPQNPADAGEGNGGNDLPGGVPDDTSCTCVEGRKRTSATLVWAIAGVIGLLWTRRRR